MSESSKIKRNMEKAAALIKYYGSLRDKSIGSEEELHEVKSKMLFTQKQILKLCLESKKIIKDIKEKSNMR